MWIEILCVSCMIFSRENCEWCDTLVRKIRQAKTLKYGRLKSQGISLIYLFKYTMLFCFESRVGSLFPSKKLDLQDMSIDISTHVSYITYYVTYLQKIYEKRQYSVLALCCLLQFYEALASSLIHMHHNKAS